MIQRLVLLNVLVYLLLKLFWIAAPFVGADFEAAVDVVLLPADFRGVAERPWTVLTYMFTQCDFRHLLVNMLWLGGFGMLLCGDIGARRVLALYIVGGVAAAAMFLLCTLTPFASGEPLAGASGSVIALTVAAGVMSPGRKVKLTYVGEVAMRQIMPVALLAFFFCSIPEAMAHAGGLLSGVVAALLWRHASKAAVAAPSIRSGASSAGYAAPDEYASLVEKANALGYEALPPAEQRRLYELTLSRSRRH